MEENVKARRAKISIHPPRVGRDLLCRSELWRGWNFNPPSPCGEGQPGRGIVALILHFNPPSPCGEGQQKLTKILCKLLR